MAMLQIIYGYQKIFKEQAEPFEKIDEEAKEIAELMLNTLYHEGAVGLGANMVGVLKRIIVVDLFENKQKNPIIAFNPEITYWSEETQTIDEASYSFPGISVPIERPKEIKFHYLT